MLRKNIEKKALAFALKNGFFTGNEGKSGRELFQLLSARLAKKN